MIVLSLFPNIGLLDKAFEVEGFCVVRGPDLIFGGDIRAFRVPAGAFTGVIGGPPCQDFSKARRGIPPTGYGLEMLSEFARVVTEAQPDWWLMENVDRVPDVTIPGYVTQRFDLNALECGSIQSRLRHFQFGSRSSITLIPERQPKPATSQPCCTATEGKRSNRRSWADFCELQGLPRDFELPDFTTEGAYRAVGNGVPIQMGRVVARAIRVATCETAQFHTCESSRNHTCEPAAQSRLCACGCGRRIAGRSDARSATPACRKRLEKQRKRDSAIVESHVNHLVIHISPENHT